MTIEAPETRIVDSYRVACDGSEGALGHPRVYLQIPRILAGSNAPIAIANTCIVRLRTLLLNDLDQMGVGPLGLITILILFWLAAALTGAFVPGKHADLPDAPAEVEIRLIRGPIHYDFLLPLDAPTRAHLRSWRAAVCRWTTKLPGG